MVGMGGVFRYPPGLLGLKTTAQVHLTVKMLESRFTHGLPNHYPSPLSSLSASGLACTHYIGPQVSH